MEPSRKFNRALSVTQRGKHLAFDGAITTETKHFVVHYFLSGKIGQLHALASRELISTNSTVLHRLLPKKTVFPKKTFHQRKITRHKPINRLKQQIESISWVVSNIFGKCFRLKVWGGNKQFYHSQCDNILGRFTYNSKKNESAINILEDYLCLVVVKLLISIYKVTVHLPRHPADSTVDPLSPLEPNDGEIRNSKLKGKIV